MYPRIVEIAQDNRHLSKYRGFLLVHEDKTELARVPLDDVAALITSGHGITVSANLISALAERGAAFVCCGSNHMPTAFLWPADSHYQQSGRIRDQVAASKPLKKRLWSQIVSAKIRHQGEILVSLGRPDQNILLMARGVRSGDPDNMEAQAARRYWPALFGDDFRRDRTEAGINAMLNYAYAVLRAGTSRAIMGAGLHPSLGLNHSNRNNSFLLVDDLMEPFRPIADRLVKQLVDEGADGVEPQTKRAMAALLATDLSTDEGVSPLFLCLERLAWSLAWCFSGEAQKLEIARPALPLESGPLDRGPS